MSGHSKWAGIKHKKAILDAKKGKVFSKIVREVTMAAKKGGGDLSSNPVLRVAVDRAKSVNMPTDNIDRAIKKGTGELPGVTYEEILYEGYGPKGVAVMVEATTDNRNRTTAEVRNIFSKKGGNLAGSGSVNWIFTKKGYILIKSSEADEDKVMSVALEAGAEDMQTEAGTYEVTTSTGGFEKVKDALVEAGIHIESAEFTMIPSSTVKLVGKDAKQVLSMMELLEDLDDVQNVYANFDIPDDVLNEE
ncbi:MAG: YebC/PmpR family DNA-binding transcriptional regulator [Candidatus Omnitrophota bacterium]